MERKKDRYRLKIIRQKEKLIDRRTLEREKEEYQIFKVAQIDLFIGIFIEVPSIRLVAVSYVIIPWTVNYSCLVYL